MTAKPPKLETAPAPKKRRDPTERIRKIGEREEIIESKLTQLQLDEERELVMNLLDQKDEIEEKKREVVKNYGAQLAAVELQIDAARRVIHAGRRRDTLLVEEYLTGANAIIRIRKDTGEQIGERNATSAELQETLPLEKPTDLPAPDDPPSDPPTFGS